MELKTSLKFNPRLDHKSMESVILKRYDEVRKKSGLFFTPDEIIDLMVEISGFETGKALESRLVV